MQFFRDQRRLEAIQIIAELGHRGQKDKVGEDYINHCQRVSAACKSIPAKIVGMLHDLDEDGHLSAFRLYEATLITDEEFRALNRLNKRWVKDRCSTNTSEEAFNEMYISGIAGNSLAREVKIADLRDNMDCDRFLRNNIEMTEADQKRVRKYDEQLRYLLLS